METFLILAFNDAILLHIDADAKGGEKKKEKKDTALEMRQTVASGCVRRNF